MKKLLLLSVLSIVLLFAGCKSGVSDDTYQPTKQVAAVTADVYESAAPEPSASPETNVSPEVTEVSIVDKFGTEIVIKQIPEKVICFSPEFVEIMVALGVGNTLIGRSSYSDYPAEVLSVPDMGDLFNLNLETIVEAKPDLILLSSMADEAMVKSLTDQGLQVVTLDADTNVEGVYTYINTLGTIFRVDEQANKMVEDMKAQISEIQSKVEGLEKPSVYFIVSAGEYTSTATPDTFINGLMELAGGENIASDGSNWMYSVEKIIEKDPEIMICSNLWDTKNTVMGLEGYKDLTAVKEGRLYEVDENIFYRQGPRLVEAIQALAEIFHPEAMK